MGFPVRTSGAGSSSSLLNYEVRRLPNRSTGSISACGKQTHHFTQGLWPHTATDRLPQTSRRQTQTPMTSQPLTIRPLSPNLQADFLRYFEGAAFADNPKWESCYCQFLYVDHAKVVWSERTAEQNRAAACARMECGRMQGLLAYRGDEVVGWCNAAPRAMLDAFADEPDPDGERLGQITCFVVAKAHRRTGIALALLDAACDMLRQQGLQLAEANPSSTATSDAENHYGPLSLYLSAGFVVHRTDADGSVVVRKSLV